MSLELWREAGVCEVDLGIICKNKVIKIREVNATVQGENVKGKEKREKYQTLGNCPSGVWEEKKPQT